MVPGIPELDDQCGRHFRYRDLIEVGETWSETRTENLPLQAGTYEAMRELCAAVLDPVVEQFGPIKLTYAFASQKLVRAIRKRVPLYPNITPSHDQHAGCELNAAGKPVCSRLGQAVDFHVPGVASGKVAHWLATNTKFDSIYFYSDKRPFHVSAGPEQKRDIRAMDRTVFGGVVPRKIKPDYLLSPRASDDLFSLKPGHWYGWTMLPGYDGEVDFSPILVEGVTPVGKKHSPFHLRFIKVGCAGGVEDFEVVLRPLARHASYLVAEIDYDGQPKDRTCIITDMTIGWLDKVCPDLPHNHPMAPDEGAQEYLNRIFRGGLSAFRREPGTPEGYR